MNKTLKYFLYYKKSIMYTMQKLIIDITLVQIYPFKQRSRFKIYIWKYLLVSVTQDSDL